MKNRKNRLENGKALKAIKMLIKIANRLFFHNLEIRKALRLDTEAACAAGCGSNNFAVRAER